VEKIRSCEVRERLKRAITCEYTHDHKVKKAASILILQLVASVFCNPNSSTTYLVHELLPEVSEQRRHRAHRPHQEGEVGAAAHQLQEQWAHLAGHQGGEHGVVQEEARLLGQDGLHELEARRRRHGSALQPHALQVKNGEEE